MEGAQGNIERVYRVIYRTETGVRTRLRRGERDEKKTEEEKVNGIIEKRGLTSPDDLGHRTGGAFLACYWSAPPRWSPRYK